jgi:3D (Asp-Asp-Asp) domain-containing protein
MLSQSVWRRLVTSLVAAGAFVLLYEATTFDSRYAAREALQRETTARPAPGARLRFSATAYCKGTTTASGVPPQSGIAASDPSLLPVGSVVQIASDDLMYSGIYTVMDTGPLVRGRHIDLYMWDCHEAVRFGRRLIELTVLRLGWNPRATTPGLIDILFKRGQPPPRRELKPPLPSRALPNAETARPTR